MAMASPPESSLSSDARRRSTLPISKRPATNEPTRTRGKRKRLSEPESIVVLDLEDQPLTPISGNRQQPSQRSSTSIKRRKLTKTPATPCRPPHTSRSNDANGCSNVGSNEVRIFPLRAILDERVKRRIKRNGLSEEMNTILNERKSRAKKTTEELQSLRDQLASKEAENERLREESSLLQETSRIQLLDRQMAGSKQGLSSNEPTFSEESTPHFDSWDMEAADAFTDDGDESPADLSDHFGDETTIEVERAHTPLVTKLNVGPTLTPPSTSPTKPSTPDFPRHLLPTYNCEAGVQASLEDIEKTTMREELGGLRSELARLSKTLDEQEQLVSELKSGDISDDISKAHLQDDADLQLQMDIMVQTVAEKTAELAKLNKSIACLGPPDADANQILSDLRDAFHSVYQELEQVYPTKESLPLSGHGVELLAVVLQSLRDAASTAREYERALDKQRDFEGSLRQQLQDRALVMDEMGRKLRQKDDRIFKLEDDVDRLRASAEGHRESVAELESLVREVEAAREQFELDLASERESSKQALALRDAQIGEMEARLASMVAVTDDLRSQLAEAHVEYDVEMAAMEASRDCELGLRDSRLAEMRAEVDGLRNALDEARTSVSQLRGDKTRLQGDAEKERKAARDTVAMLRTQLLQTLQMSEAFLAPPAPSHEPVSADVAVSE